MADLTVTLPSGEDLGGSCPIVIIGPNGSGKTREARRLAERTQHPTEFINALRNTRISQQLPAMSQLQARQSHDSVRNLARGQPWEIAADFDFVLAELLAADGDSARTFRRLSKRGEDVGGIGETALEVAEQVWEEVFPGRKLDWKDWSPVVQNERDQVLSYSANQMSDGERAALYLLAKVLLAQEGSVLVVDEPETHFHSHLAVELWNSLEQRRPDLRFVYVTHDLTFALSRHPVLFLLADPRSGLVPIDAAVGLPLDVRREILGAASFSYFASRIVFCEGTQGSLDNLFFSGWFPGRDSVVLPVGSCDDVRTCVHAHNEARVIDNLEAVGIIDRDFRPEAFFENVGPSTTVLPVHEIEGLLCLPEVVACLSNHLGAAFGGEVVEVVRGAIGDEEVFRVAVERTRLALRNLTEDAIFSKPADWKSEDALKAHFRNVDADLGSLIDSETMLAQELEALQSIRDIGEIRDLLRVFPSRGVAAAVAKRLGTNVTTLFQLMSRALRVTGSDQELAGLGQCLEEAFADVGLPRRRVAQRATTSS
ncbi:MAG: AAA family ATPase [Actinomycetota bacterium]|nr:AAA family ATPase [Actinomycetota bacterium]